MLTNAQRLIVAVISQALFYGIYIATTIQCFRWLIFTDDGWKPREKVNSLSIGFATIFIFLTSTTNLITGLQYMLQALGRDDMRDMYGIVIAMNISELLGIISIDSALIYRCWIVHAKSWRIICVPVTFWFASLACSALFSYYGQQSLIAAKGQLYRIKCGQIEGNALTGFYVCNIATTIYTTTAIIYRIRYTTKNGGGNSKRLNYVMRILAESGILYTSMTVFCLVGSVLVNVMNNPTWVENLIYAISDPINFSMAGISFNLILIRVYQSRVELRDSLADSRNVDGPGERSLSEMQFINHRIAEGPALDEAMQEHRRSSGRMHEN